MEKDRKILIIVLTLTIIWAVVFVSAVTFSLPDEKVISKDGSYLTVNDEYAVDNENKIIYFIPLNTIAKNIINEEETNVTYIFADKNGRELSDDSKLQTGDKIIINFNNNTEEYTFSILGDLYGEGKASKIGAKFIAKQIINRDNELSKLQFYAADIDGNKSIHMNDVLRIVKEILVNEEENQVRLVYSTNGAQVSRTTDVCSKLENETCEITLPSITRDGWEIIGFSKLRDSHEADYDVDETIEVSESMILYAITSKSFDIEFDANGSDTLTENLETINCTLYNTQDDYKIVMPEIIKNNGNVIGWSINSGATDSNIASKGEVYVNKTMKYYAITSMNYTLSFDKNGSDSLESNESYSCISYNGNNCIVNVLLPKIYHKGYEIIGYNTNQEAVIPMQNGYVPGNMVEIQLNQNKTLYAITGKVGDSLEFNNQQDLNGFSIDLQKNVNYPQALNYIYQNAANWLLINGKIFILDKETYDLLGITNSVNGSSLYPTVYFNDDMYFYDLTDNLAIAWKNYYYEKTNDDMLEDKDFKTLYEEYHNNQSGEKSKEDYFASLVSYYFWDVIVKNDSYSVDDRDKITDLSNENKAKLIDFVEKAKTITLNNFSNQL